MRFPIAVGLPLVVAIFFSGTDSRAEATGPVWLVVTTNAFTEAIEPLAQQRRADGYRVVVTTESVATAIKSNPKLEYLLLVGDDQQANSEESWHVASRWKPLYKWIATQDPKFAADAAYGDLDEDGIPEISVGRIPARSAQEVETAVAKILRYESRPLTVKDLELVAWTGSPMYGPALDRLATSLALGTIDRYAPQWAEVWLQVADDRHALFAWPEDHAEAFQSALSDGACLAVVAAHGWTGGFVSVRTELRDVSYTVDHAAARTARTPSAPSVLFTCDSGNFASSERSLTEAMLFAPGGPVAVIGATTQSHPLTNYYSQQALLETLTEAPPTIGDLWRYAQAKMPKMYDLLMEQALKDVEGKLEDNINVSKLKRDQLLMYALLGDPATKLRLPKRLAARVEKRGDVWRWQVDKPDAATQLHISFRPDGMKMPRRPATISREEAIALHHQALRTLRFAELSTVDADAEWQGEVDQPGRLRMIAITDQAIHATTVDLQAEKGLTK
ncbi:MAG: C25 family cysteine peptidase [Aeoliella sp.]